MVTYQRLSFTRGSKYINKGWTEKLLVYFWIHGHYWRWLQIQYKFDCTHLANFPSLFACSKMLATFQMCGLMFSNMTYKKHLWTIIDVRCTTLFSMNRYCQLTVIVGYFSLIIHLYYHSGSGSFLEMHVAVGTIIVYHCLSLSVFVCRVKTVGCTAHYAVQEDRECLLLIRLC